MDLRWIIGLLFFMRRREKGIIVEDLTITEQETNDQKSLVAM